MESNGKGPTETPVVDSKFWIGVRNGLILAAIFWLLVAGCVCLVSGGG